MHAPPLVGWLLVLLCAAAAAYCLVRARTGPDACRGDARGEGLMALGMAAMALPASAVTPPRWSPWMFTAVFAVAGVWALVRRHLHHAVGTLAMVYMALAMAVPPDRMNAAGPVGQAGSMGSVGSMGPTGRVESMGAMGAMEHAGPGGVPLLTGLLLVYYTVYVIGAGVRLVPADPGPPGVLRACRVAMGIGMLAMLLAL
ncbi:protein of unknown function [Streptomyces sp. 2224.1]|uniref:DUF5134 domain-containing protein n=1 Tax=unclassified Streptomyces TaxID=2593676 RepID=UPI0008912F50|nr:MULTISPECIES: DUF5134 domain-containing protein [unclassified Streptomyces]PBC81166.1 uncharacterized protein DUF5134 [Streptomyces sp. 2321.6]SDR56153.1 protein of unknown function [Streptomyces sp. KS_16]SEC03910.1 protein of unknown function [Streptomyces sp. 2133.1]SED24650.1 protein of unknown function [Streptomyces sp. 2224.1]SEF09869.1 protein of unknown function [Streptomyces sp. 2112.3]